MESVEFLYDGIDTVVATITGATVGQTYAGYSNDPGSSGDSQVAASSTVVLTWGSIGGFTPADLRFGVLVFNNTSKELVGTTAYQKGSTLPAPFEATWHYDGSSVAVTFFGESGVDYEVDVYDRDDSYSDTVTGAGADVTVTVPIASPFAGRFVGQLYSVPPLPYAFYIDQSLRSFQEGFVGSGDLGNPSVSSIHAISVWLYNLDTSEGVDISRIALTKRHAPRHNQPNSSTFVVEVPAGHALVTDAFTDGYPAMRKGNRKLLAWRDGDIIHNGRVFSVERNGDGRNNRAIITSMGPSMELGYESEDRAGRPVRDETGNFIDPTFDSPITGAELVFQILTNSQVVGDEGDPGGEGPLPIDLTTGTFSSTADLSPENNMSWPILAGDFFKMLVDTDLIDIVWRPVDPAEGLDPYAMVAVSVVDLHGSDVSGTVHFDYWTGSFNAKNARHVEDFATINNKLYDYLGPRIDKQHWAGNITPGSPGTTADPTDSRTLYGGQFMQIRVYDANDVENTVRPLFLKLWDAEQRLRMEPRDVLFLTPSPDSKALFQPYTDYSLGDLIAVNVGGDFGVNIAGIQRVYGWDVEWDRQGIERVTNIIVTADAA